MATGSASTAPAPRPPPRRERRRSPSEERIHGRGWTRDLGEDDHGSERRRQRHSRSPEERRSKHSGRHRDESRQGRDDERRRRRTRDGSRDDRRRRRSLSKSRDGHNRSRSASHERHDKRRRRRDRSGSPTRSHRKDRNIERSVSPRYSRRSGRGRSRSRSRSPKRRKPSTSLTPPPRSKRSTKPLPSQEAAYTGSESGPVDKPVDKEKPNFNQTGLLARETNTVAGTNVVLKYNEPPDARKPPPRDDWRLYVFKGQDLLHTLELGSRSCWLIGREPAVADLLVEHPSTSKQHAVLQFRYTTRTNEFGDKKSKVRPYLIDLESSNGSFLNGKKVEATRYVELMAQDIIKFGQSEREYVLMLAPA